MRRRTEPQPSLPSWLPASARVWTRENGGLLAEIFAPFCREGTWPKGSQLRRALYARGDGELAAAIDAIPNVLARLEHQDDTLALTLFGLGCVPAAAELLEHYVAVLGLALERYGDAELPARLSRADVVEALGLDELSADRLSRVLLSDCPFLAGGDAGLRSWDLEIDPRVVRFAGARSPNALLEQIAGDRALDRQPGVIAMGLPPLDSETARRPTITAACGRAVRLASRAARWALALVGASLTAFLVGKLTGVWGRVADAVDPPRLVSVDVERDPSRFDATVPYDWERYDFVIDRRLARLPAPPAGGCRARYAWATKLGGWDASRSKLRVYLRGQTDEPVVLQGVRLRMTRAPAPARGVDAICQPPGGATPNPLMLFGDLDRGALRYGRPDEPPRPFLITLKKGEVEALEVQVRTRRHDVRWWLELDARTASGEQHTLRIDDHGRPFRTSAPPPARVEYRAGRWRPAAATDVP